MCSKSLLKTFISIFILSTCVCLLSSGCRPSGFEQDSLGNFEKRYEDLVKSYNRLIKKDPDNPKLKIKLAEFCYKFRDYLKIKELLTDIDDHRARAILAKSLVKLKDYDQAIEVFQQLKTPPKDPEYFYLYGELLEKKNLFPKALKVYSKIQPPFKKLAQERINFIKYRVDDVVPSEIVDAFKEAEDFIGQIGDEGAVILSVDEKIEINPDNTSLSTIHVVEKVLKERGKELAEVVIGYDSTYERVELELARTITEDGKVVYAGRENIRNIGRYLDFPLYSNSKAFIVSMPSVDVGSIIEYKIKIYSSKLVNEDDFGFTYRLREAYPIFKSNFSLIVPKGKEVNFKFLNSEYSMGIDLKPSLIKKDKKKKYLWSFDRIKPIIPEYSMPSNSYINPAILISSFSSWDQIYKWWSSLYQDKVKLTQEMKDFVGNITKDSADNRDKAKKIYQYVAKNIRYVAIEYGDSGHEPHHAEEVFVNRYGDCKDQAILLTAMLREAGFKAYPVLIPTRSAYPVSKDFPSINFNHAICALEMNGDFIFMDPTAETTAFEQLPLADQDRLVLMFLEDGPRLLNTDYSRDNGVTYNMDIEINNEENAKIKRTITSKGFFASAHRGYLKYTHPATIEEDLRKKMMAISSLSELIDYEIRNPDNFDAPPEVSYEFNTEKFLNPAGNLRIVSVLDQIGLDYSLISKDKRKYPIDFKGLYTKVAKIRIVLPKNLKVKYLPSSKSLENSWFKLNVSYQDNFDYVDFYQEYTTKKRFVSQAEYQEFKDYLKRAIYLLREEIILQGSEK